MEPDYSPRVWPSAFGQVTEMEIVKRQTVSMAFYTLPDGYAWRMVSDSVLPQYRHLRSLRRGPLCERLARC